jgi:choline dehydrogenase-like flavoprotein
MIVDASTPEREVFAGDFDVCVIGTGPAGITLARRLARQGLRIALMEAGDLEWSPESQDVYEGEIDSEGFDFPPLDMPRLRYFGGTSNHWNGLCRELYEADFEPRPHNPMSGWPIGPEALAPYREETNRILDIEPLHVTPAPPNQREGDAFRTVDFLRSPPTRFAEKYKDELAASEAIVLGLNANLVDLRLEEESLSRVTEAVFRSYASDDPGFAVRARAFCLCAGGI